MKLSINLFACFLVLFTITPSEELKAQPSYINPNIPYDSGYVYFKGENKFIKITNRRSYRHKTEQREGFTDFHLCEIVTELPENQDVLRCEHITTAPANEIREAIQCAEDTPDYLMKETNAKRRAGYGRWILGSAIVVGVSELSAGALPAVSAIGMRLGVFSGVIGSLETLSAEVRAFVNHHPKEGKTEKIDTEILNENIFNVGTERLSNISSDEYIALLRERVDTNVLQGTRIFRAIGAYCKIHDAITDDDRTYEKDFNSRYSSEGQSTLEGINGALAN